MNTSIAHLPNNKQKELKHIVSSIQAEIPNVEFVILFGSYATNEYVDYDQRTEFGLRTLYRSDFDLAVLTNDNQDDYITILNRVVNKSYKGQHPNCVMSIQFVHSTINDFNKSIKEGRYFFSEILREGILLFDRGNYKLESVRELNFQEILKLAKEYFKDRYSQAESFLKQAKFAFERQDYRMSSYELHQAVENYLVAINLVSTLYSPKGHNLYKLIDDSRMFTDKAALIFFTENNEDERLFELLNNAYVQARYNKDFLVNKTDIEQLFIRTEQLRSNAKFFCEQKINEYLSKING